jgi:hypothetical protein
MSDLLGVALLCALVLMQKPTFFIDLLKRRPSPEIKGDF